MSKIEFIYGKGGKKVMMARRYADTLAKLGHGTFVDTTYQDKMLPSTSEADDLLVSEAVMVFAQENGVDISKVIGTGKDGRVKKSDVEAVIAAQDLA